MIARAALRAPVATPVLIGALGCAALAFRSVAPIASIPTAMVGVIGMLAWRRSTTRADATRWIAVTVTGCAGFSAALLLGDALAPRAVAFSVFSVTLAAVAEEAFFRRFLYGWLERWGPALAIALTSVLFGLIHVPVYGWAILPLDIAAGALLGWQRWASGTWTAPAVAHVVANLVVFL